MSSPGIGNPLKFKRQYFKNIGRKVEVTLKEEGKKVTGILKSVDDNGIHIEYEVKEKVGKKNVKSMHLHFIEDGQIEKIIVKVSF